MKRQRANPSDCQEDAMYRLLDARDTALYNVWSEFIDARKKARKSRGYQRWDVIPKRRLVTVWKSFAKYGFVRDETALEEIAAQCIENIGRLYANTLLSGHTQDNPIHDLESAGFEYTEEELEPLLEEFYDWIFIPDEGQYRISDYAFNKLHQSVIDYVCAESPNEKLLAIDHLLNVIHMRTDLAASFVEGGRKTLTEIGAIEKE